MYQKSDLNGPRHKLTTGAAETEVFLDEQSLPFDHADFARMDPDHQSWLLEGFLCAQDIERFRLGQELHDSTGQLLVALRLNIARVKELDAEFGSGDLFREIDLTVGQIEKEMRAFSFVHYPAQMQQEGFAAALENFVRGFGQRTGLDVTFRNLCRVQLCSEPAAIALLRVAQEALTNVYRHAHATSVRILVAYRRGKLELCIEDDGQGLPDVAANCRTGVGLRSMIHRMESHGGQLILQRLTHGTRVTASVPVDRIDLDLR
jgi:signal transduction histidine kinase